MTEQLRLAADQLDAAWNNSSKGCLALQNKRTQESHVRGSSPGLARLLDAEWAFMSSFSAKVEQTRFAIRRARNYSSGIAPINALPREILTRIFQFVFDQPCQLDQLHSHTSGKMLHYADDLAQVCFLWRQIAISCPSLWNHIDLTQEDEWYKCLIDRAAIYTDRAGRAPVELHVTDDYDYDNKNQDYNQLHGLLHQISHLVGTLEIVATGKIGHFHRTLLEALFLEKDSNLKKLVLCSEVGHKNTFVSPCSIQPGHFGLDLTDSQFTRGCSTISIFHARGIFPFWSSTAYCGLVDLRLLLTSRSSSIRESDIQSILQSSPGLRILHFGLEIPDQVPEAKQVTPVFLQDLEVVRVLSAGETHKPLRSSGIIRLLAPGQKALRLSLEDHDTCSLPDTLPSDLNGFLSRASVVQIYIQRLVLPLSLPFPHSAHLECLIISHFHTQSQHQILAGLAHTDGGHLKSLRVRRSHLLQDHLRALLSYCPAGIVLEESCIYSDETGEPHGFEVSKLSTEQVSVAFPEVKIVPRSPGDPMTDWDDIY